MAKGCQTVLWVFLAINRTSAFFVGAPIAALSCRSPPSFLTTGAKHGSSRVPSMATSNMFPKANAKHLHDGEDFAVEFSDLRDSFKQQSGEGNNLGPFGLDGHARRTMGAGAAALMPLFVGVATASAKGGAFGIIEGRTASFLHPIIMGTLFVISIRSAILGLEWREQRTMSSRMSALKEKLPLLSSGSRASTPLSRQAGEIQAKLAEFGEDVAEAAAGLKTDLAKLSSPSAKEIEAELEAMTTRRKELSSKNVRDRHYDLGAILLGLGTFSAIEGPVNTFLRAEKLFPGPHLYAGASIVVAWAVAASLVPQMQKGNDTARLAHIGINFGMIALFAWQLFTGFEIAVKVWEFTKWP